MQKNRETISRANIMSLPTRSADPELGTLINVPSSSSLSKLIRTPMATAGLYQEELPFNSFLIPRNASSLPVFKRKKILNRWQRFQLWFNTYR